MRIGTGFDIHPLAPGRPLVLGGVVIPSDKGCVGHSDGDALTHAIIDSLLGALALGDIGKMFPDSDSRYKGIDSLKLLKAVLPLLAGHRIVNIDSTVILQAPKLGPHTEAIRRSLADSLGIDISCISVKGKTAEKLLGELGSGDAVVAQALALVE